MNIQINKGNAVTQNIENQYNSFVIPGTPFVPFSGCDAEKYYESIKDCLYYPRGYLDRAVAIMETEHSILIQGEQGSGKSILSFKIAELMQKQGLITSVYYLKSPSDWNAIKQWIQTICFQEKEGNYLWIIDNLHKIPNAIEDFPDSSIWGTDYCVCCTRNLNSVPSENDLYLGMTLSQDQIFRRSIDEKIFLECYNAIADQKIGRHESDLLYRYIGGNLALLRYIITSGNLPHSLDDWRNGQFIDFHRIYDFYFGFETARRITKENLDDILRMLFLSQIDFSIPLHLQCEICQTVLKDFYFETVDKELDIEHASLAELLTVSICREYRLDYDKAFADCLHWIVSKLVNHRLEEQEQGRQVNRFLQLLYSYKYVLSSDQALPEILSYDEHLLLFLEENADFIALSTWKTITGAVKEDSKVNEVFHNAVISMQFVDTMCINGDFDFRFFQERLSQAERDDVDKRILSHAAALIESVVVNGNEVNFMHLLLSLSEEAAVKLIEQIPSDKLGTLLSGNDNGLSLFTRFYAMLTDRVKNILGNKLSTNDYRQIFIKGASVKGFVSFLAAASDSMQKELCCLLTDGLPERLIQNTIQNNYSIGTVGLSLRELKKESAETLRAFEEAIGIEGYEELLRLQGTVIILARLIQYSSAEMQREMSCLLQSKPELVRILVERTIREGSSIGTLDLSLGELKKESEETLRAFEGAIGVEGYEELLRSQGTVSILVRLIRSSSAEMQREMSCLLQSQPELVRILVERTIREGSSIGTLDLSLGELKKESEETLRAFEGAIGVEGYEELLRSQGTVSILARLIRSSSAEMQREMSCLLQSQPELVRILVERTIREGSSIGTLDLSLGELKKESEETLRAFEGAIGIEGYEELLKSQGTVNILAHLIENSSAEMQKEMSCLLQSQPELVRILVERTIREGSSIGTLHLCLRELKKKSVETLRAFEGAIGVEGYEELLRSQGTVSILASLIQYSSVEMQKDFSNLLQSKLELVRILVERTIREGSSIGTLDLSLRELKKESVETLRAFEEAIGVEGYEELLRSQGTVSILARLIQHSSTEMQKEMSCLLQSKPELVRILVEKTIREGSSIGTLNCSIKVRSGDNASCLQVLENLIGIDGYLAMFTKCNVNSITILRIMASSFLSDSLVDLIYANMDVWNESGNYISENSWRLMKDFHIDLYYARKNHRIKFFDFIRDVVPPEEWLGWMRQGATLEEAVLILRNLPFGIAKRISNIWLQNYAEVTKDLLFVEQQRIKKGIIKPDVLYREIMSIKNYNEQLSALISKEYSELPFASYKKDNGDGRTTESGEKE